jgi:hypothetical protein
MATTTTTETTKKPAYSKKTLKKQGREKLAKKLATDVEFKKTYFDTKSKRSVEKKAAFRKKKKGKK